MGGDLDRGYGRGVVSESGMSIPLLTIAATTFACVQSPASADVFHIQSLLDAEG